MKAGRRNLWLFFLVMASVIAWVPLAPPAPAYETYHDPAQDGTGRCATCHPGFVGRGALHDAHWTFGTTTCNLCHTGSGRNNPLTVWSTGDGAANSTLGCAGCHGTNMGETIQSDINNGSSTFSTAGLPKSSGYGLRKRHLLNGVTTCLTCHADAQRCNINPESTIPLYFPRTDTVPTHPCTSEGLDNDGDGRTDSADPDCNAALPLTPGEVAACGGGLLVTGIDPAGDITLSYGPACGTAETNVYYGPLTQADLASYNYTGAACAQGTGGSLTFNPGAGSFFFVLAGDDLSVEGPYGEAYGAWDPNQPGLFFHRERPADAAGLCGVPRDLTGRCD